MKKILSILVIFYSIPSLAECDATREALKDAEKWCNTGGDVTGVVGVIGMVCMPFTLGLSSMVPLIPAAGTEWACRHKNYLETVLRTCTDETETDTWTKAGQDKARASTLRHRVEGYNRAVLWRQRAFESAQHVFNHDVDIFTRMCLSDEIDQDTDENLIHIQAYLEDIERKHRFNIEAAELGFDFFGAMWFTKEQRIERDDRARKKIRHFGFNPRKYEETKGGYMPEYVQEYCERIQ